MKKVIALLLIASVCSVANAAYIHYKESFTSIIAGDPVEILTFNQFDPSLGTLTGISIQYGMTKYGITFQADNDSATEATVTFSQGVGGDISSTDVSLINSSFQPITGLDVTTSIQQHLDATTGDSTTKFDETGNGDYFSWNTGDATLWESQAISQFAFTTGTIGYIGTGTFDIEFETTQINTASTQGVFTATGPSTVDGYVIIGYVYEPVPEPATMALLGLGGLFIKRRRA